jgi:hypothetical protein
LPLLDDGSASPASRRLASGPTALATRRTGFFSSLLASREKNHGQVEA